MTERVNVKQLADEIAQQPTDDNSHLWRKGDALDDTRRAVTVAMNMHSDSDGIIPHIAGMVERGEIKPFSDFGRPPVSFAKFAECPAEWFISTADASRVKEFFRQSSPANTAPQAAPTPIPIEQSSQGIPTPEKISVMQEDEILRIIRDGLKQDPKKLSKQKAGTAGIKADVRKLLSIPNPTFQSIKVFDKAWQRLRDSSKICDK